jgi:ATP-dependent Lhr-like helicase
VCDPNIQAHLDPQSREAAILDALRARGAMFFAPLHEGVGGGYPGETVQAIWNLVWQGLVTNDTFHALRLFTRASAPSRRTRRIETASFRSRRLVPPTAEGRWTLVHRGSTTSATRWAAAWAHQLLDRHGVLTREAILSEAIGGGFGLAYPVLKAMEESGRIRRGYFVAGLGATQFALPGALDLVRSLRESGSTVEGAALEVVVLAATDPANPYGTTLKWPPLASADASAGRGPTRTVGATVILMNGALVAYLARGDRQLLTYLPDAEPERSRAGHAVARVLIERARSGGDSPRGMLIEEIDGLMPATHPMGTYLAQAGFISGAMGYHADLRV